MSAQGGGADTSFLSQVLYARQRGRLRGSLGERGISADFLQAIRYRIVSNRCDPARIISRLLDFIDSAHRRRSHTLCQLSCLFFAVKIH